MCSLFIHHPRCSYSINLSSSSRASTRHSRMGMRTVSCTVILLISMVITDAKTMEPVSVSTNESISLACDNCLLVSRKAEATLNSQRLFDEAHKICGEACHAFPSYLQDNCLRKSGAYLHEARVFLHQLFGEGHFCKETGSLANPEYQVQNGLVLIDDELLDERGCMTCRRAVRDMFNKLKNPKMRTKVFEAFLDYCEEAEEDEDQCKMTMYRYAAIILRKLQKFKPIELCNMIGMCDEGITVKI